MKKVIAFSLWGQSPRYWVGARRNIDLAAIYYPGWICRFYVEKGLPGDLLAMLQGDNVEVELMERRDQFGGRFWRFLAAADPEMDLVLSCDCDSRIGSREVAAVRAWLESGMAFHIMRDHPCHQFPILGGMWGCRKGVLPQIREMMAGWTYADVWGCDQDFLAAMIYPLVRDCALEHSELGIAFGGAIQPFPTNRADREFVGQIFDENEVGLP